MKFLEMCEDLFERMSDADDLKKDVENYNRLKYYIANFGTTKREDIEAFIILVRSDNVIYSAIQEIARMFIYGPQKRLNELPLPDLYNELKGEKDNLILKGAYDSIKVLNKMTPEQDKELQNRFARWDMTIFTQYRCR